MRFPLIYLRKTTSFFGARGRIKSGFIQAGEWDRWKDGSYQVVDGGSLLQWMGCFPFHQMLNIVYLRQLVRMPANVVQRHILCVSLVLIPRALEK
jgi:hypothetical protein